MSNIFTFRGTYSTWMSRRLLEFIMSKLKLIFNDLLPSSSSFSSPCLPHLSLAQCPPQPWHSHLLSGILYSPASSLLTLNQLPDGGRELLTILIPGVGTHENLCNKPYRTTFVYYTFTCQLPTTCFPNPKAPKPFSFV